MKKSVCIIAVLSFIVVGMAFLSVVMREAYAAPGTDFAFILYNNTQKTYVAPWMQLINKTDGRIWNGSGFVSDPNVYETDIRPSQLVVCGGWAFTIPAGVATGEYDLLIKDSANGAESNGDVTQVGFRLVMPERIIYNPVNTPQDNGRIRVDK